MEECVCEVILQNRQPRARMQMNMAFLSILVSTLIALLIFASSAESNTMYAETWYSECSPALQQGTSLIIHIVKSCQIVLDHT
ncbi:hypothetical protein P4O66_014800 [Electrophorus voltai]|uniref:Uncharacterized protein n=1 Tax=Electrophorus voltai TaxID=2609070 RepID=A0AAD9DSD4_9TELE|nr:hypothetical protein P4O66_014800 [Electrophorus voltai]